MTEQGVSESTVEEAALDWLAGLGWSVAHGPISHPVNQRPITRITARLC